MSPQSGRQPAPGTPAPAAPCHAENAPAALSELSFTAAVTRCDRIQISGVPASLQRAANVRELVCAELQSLSRTVTLGEVMDISASPLLREARVQRFELDSDSRDLRVGLDLDVRFGLGTASE